MNGKGDDARPFSVPPEVYDENHERTFGRQTKWVSCWRSGCPNSIEVDRWHKGAVFCSETCKTTF